MLYDSVISLQPKFHHFYGLSFNTTRQLAYITLANGYGRRLLSESSLVRILVNGESVDT